MIEVGKTYKDARGRNVRIIATDRHFNHYPVIGLVDYGAYEETRSYRHDGLSALHSHNLIIPQLYVKLDDVRKALNCKFSTPEALDAVLGSLETIDV